MMIAVVGAKGRMGQAVIRLAGEQGITVSAALDQGDELAVEGADAVIDFSHPEVLSRVAESAAKAKAALVSGTTGLDGKAQSALDAAAKLIPVMWEPNMSVGVLVLGRLLEQALEMLGTSVDVEIVEAHHKLKVDAPSGTALRLLEIAKEARGDDKITVHAVRGGDVIGDHTVHLLGMGERIELTHRATSRDLFARGALHAARALVGKPAGRYRLGDIL